MVWYLSCKYIGNWETSVEPLLNIVTRNRGVTFLNLIHCLVVLLDNTGLCFLSQVYVSSRRLSSVLVPLNLFLARCIFFFIFHIKLRRNTFFHSVTEAAPTSFLVFSGICCLWIHFSNLFLQGIRFQCKTLFFALDICQLINYN